MRVSHADRVVLAAMLAAARTPKERRILKRNIRMMEAMERVNEMCRNRRSRHAPA